MIFMIIGVITAILFPYFLIKAIREDEKFYTIISCICSGVTVCMIFVVLNYIIENQ